MTMMTHRKLFKLKVTQGDRRKRGSCWTSGDRNGQSGASGPGGTVQGAAFEGEKILKFGRFWRIRVYIAESDILHP